MRSRPDVELRMSNRVHPGDVVLAELVVKSRSTTPVEFVDLHLEGTEVSRVEGRIISQHHFISLVARVAKNITLVDGEHRYRATFAVPFDVPCTYLGARAEIRYGMRLAISIPWWFDVRESYEVFVTPRSTPRPPRQAVASTTESGVRPFVEVFVDDHAFAPGDEFSGAIALGNIQGRKLRGVELSLVGFERLRHAGDRANEAHRFTTFRQADSGDEGRELPFRFRIPHEIPASFDAGWVALSWALEIRVDLGTGNIIRHITPITIGTFDRPAETEVIRRQVGSLRWRRVWGAAAAQRNLVLDSLELRLTGTLFGCSAAIFIDPVSTSDGALVGELHWPSWGIDLQIARKRFMLLFSSDDEEGLGNRYRIRGRDAHQVRAVLTAPLRRALLSFDDIRLDDEHVTVRSRSPGHDQPWLDAFLDRLTVLADEISKASQRIPPPMVMASMLDVWQAFALELHGRLQIGRMSILDAQLDGVLCSLSTCFERSPDPVHTELKLVIDPPLDMAFDTGDPNQVQQASLAVRELIQSLQVQSTAIHVNQDAITVTLPAPLADPTTVRDILKTQFLLVQCLRRSRSLGPYR